MMPSPSSLRRRSGPVAIAVAVTAVLVLCYRFAPPPRHTRIPPAGPAAPNAAASPTLAGNPLVGAWRPASAATRPAAPVVPADGAGTGRVVRLLAAPDAASRERILLEVVAQGNAAVPLIQEALRSAVSPDALDLLFRALAAIGTVDSMDVFMAFLDEDAHRPLRERLAPQLASLESPEPAEQVLNWLMASTDYDVTLACVECLPRIADAPLLAVLRIQYGEPERSQFQKDILCAIVKKVRDPGCIPALADLLRQNREPALRDAAAAGLAHIGSPAAVDALLERIGAEGDLPADHPLFAALSAVRNKETRAHLKARFDAAADPKVKHALGYALSGL
jgi:hypothetical protein